MNKYGGQWPRGVLGKQIQIKIFVENLNFKLKIQNSEQPQQHV